MKKIITPLLALLFSGFLANAGPGPVPGNDFAIREIHYAGRLTDRRGAVHAGH